MYTDFSSDGCPNNCEYCRTYGYTCIYKDPDSELRANSHKCVVCGKTIPIGEEYQYKDNYYCENCFDFS